MALLLQQDTEYRTAQFQLLFRPEFISKYVPDRFIEILSTYIKGATERIELIDFITWLQPLPDETIMVDMDNPISAGKFGSIYQTLDKSSVLKFNKLFFPNTDINNYVQQYALIKEAYIQHILSTDDSASITAVIPTLLGIYSYTKGSDRFIVFHMEKLDFTVGAVWDHTINTASNKKLPYKHINRLYSIVIGMLTQLYDKYRFSHRDLKLDNIMIKRATGQVKIIDFGMSAMTLVFNGREYRIVNDISYQYNTKCNPKQDLGVLSAFILLRYYDRGFLDNKGVKFFNYLFTGNTDRAVNKEEANTFIKRLANRHNIRKASKPDAVFWHSAYNFKGNLYTNECPLSSRFSLENIRELLAEFDKISNNI